MLEFVGRGQQYPSVEDAAHRRLHFHEIYARFGHEAASEQSARCSQCGIPFCQIHCPLQNNIPDWLRLTAEGRLEEAYAASSATNAFPEICGRICPQDKLCEGNCVIERGFGAVTIGAVEKYITEEAFARGWVKPARVERESGLSVGIIGAGPAGLAAADMLRRAAHAVHVYDRYDRAGGLLIYGIPNFKLEKQVVARRRALLEEGGIRFHLNCSVGETVSLAELRARHDAVLIATGVYRAKEGDAENANLENIVPALPYLIAGNRRGLGDAIPENEHMNAAGKRVIVIGGGDTAMDCVRTAVRQGAESVTCLYRRDRANMPGSAREVKHAEEEGVRFEWLAAPLAYLGKTRAEGVRAQRMRLLPPGADGRRAIEKAEGETFTLPADMAINALGFDAEDLPRLWNEPGLALSPRGTVQVDNATMMTSLPGVFAAGDIVRGASLVVWAIKDGRDAAAGMEKYLRARERKAA